jgi:hypothetical protein
MTRNDAYNFDTAMWDPQAAPSRTTAPSEFDGLRYRTYLWHEYDKDGSKNEPVRYRLLGDPDSEEANKRGLWVFVPHQVSVRESRQSLLMGVPQLPNGVSAVPLRGKDDPLLEKVLPGRYNIDSQTKQVKTQAAVLGLFADEEDQVQILELTARQWRQLCERLSNWREDFEDPSWSLVGRPITIQKEGVKGTPGATSLIIRMVKGVKPTPPGQLPDGYDLRNHLAEIRSVVDEALGVEPDGVAVEPIRTITPQAKDTGDTSAEVQLLTLSNTELMELLTEHNISVTPKTRRAILLQKATDAGLGVIEPVSTDDPPF